MAQLSVAPTKSNLLDHRRRLEFAKLGHELLDQKRNILVNELLRQLDQAEENQSKFTEAVAGAFDALKEAARRSGVVGLQRIAPSVNISAEILLQTRRVMGVALPVVETEFEDHPPYYSSPGETVRVDLAIVRFREATEIAGRLAESKTSILRLSREVRKTIRKVNALEKIAIPDLEAGIGTIANRLDEVEREMFVLMKTVKKRLARRLSDRKAIGVALRAGSPDEPRDDGPNATLARKRGPS